MQLAGIYDLLIPFVIFLSICMPVRECLPFILALGFIVDNLSGSPFGLYLTFYFWLLVSMRWIIKYLRAGNKLFLSLIVIAAVLIENILVMGLLRFLDLSGNCRPKPLKTLPYRFFGPWLRAPCFC